MTAGRGWRRWAACCCALAIALACGAARADTPVALFQSFAGNVNFVGTQQSMRDRNNNRPCSVVSSTTEMTAKLSGLPAGATVLSAQLYWAASGSNPDYSVMFEGGPVSAPAARQYFSHTIGSGFDYFSGAVDVTAQVASKRNGDYRFYGLTLTSGAPYCATQAVLGGFALLVVYSHPDEPFRVLNVYEGFQYFRYNGFTLTLGNFRVPDPLNSATGRLGHITWEGDSTLAKDGEELLFNGVGMKDTFNPAGNQFNSKSNINKDSASFGIDFDAYDVGSPVIKAGQTSATTRYQSGQDLVLLSAEIIAVPNVPTADLGLSMTRDGALLVGRNVSYSLSVSSGGPNTESGPLTITDTLPPGMSYVSASGAGWSCAAAGQVVTCSYAGSLAKGGTLAPITLTALVSAPGKFTNSASVAGRLFDNVSANNSASDAATATAGTLAYLLTDAPCVPNKPFTSDLQTCHKLEKRQVAGAEFAAYVTAVDAGLTPTPVSSGAETAVSMRFALSCVNPANHAGISASYAGVTLPLCAAAGGAPAASGPGWSGAVSLVFPANSPSALVGANKAVPLFRYDDVGLIELNLIDSADRVVPTTFVSKPALLVFTGIRRSSDGVSNPGAQRPDLGFVAAGEEFTIGIEARTAATPAAPQGKRAPNFGLEGVQLALVQDGPLGAEAQKATVNLPELTGAFETLADGVISGTRFAWSEAGIIRLTPQLSPNNYLGAGSVDGLTETVGRFYPGYFQTTTVAAFQCLPRMACPATVSGGVYTRQPFTVNVTALGLGGNPLMNYNGLFARKIILSALDQAGGSAPNPPGGGGVLASAAIEAAAPRTALAATPHYTLPVRFSAAAPRALNWTGPTSIFLRATATEQVAAANGASRYVVISSQVASKPVEGGVTVVNGRLQLSNAFGSELLKLPVKMSAQFWTAAARASWENNSTDNVSQMAYAVNFTSCQKRLSTGGAGLNNCKPGLLGVVAGPPLLLKDGGATVWLRAPGRGADGSTLLQMTEDNPAWLPSTVSRATFGIYTSPLIYTRELY